MFYVKYDGASRRLTYSSAGHNRPVLYRPATSTHLDLDAEGLILGVRPTFDFEEKELELQPGDVLLLYTDGVTEATSPDGEMYGTERLCLLLDRLHGEPTETILAEVFREVNEFVAVAGPGDAERDARELSLLGAPHDHHEVARVAGRERVARPLRGERERLLGARERPADGLVAVEAVPLLRQDRDPPQLDELRLEPLRVDAREIRADAFLIASDVPGVSIDRGKPGERLLGRTPAAELERHQAAGQFPAGSMGPKVQAILEFHRATGKRGIICHVEDIERAVLGETGTEIV